MDDADLALARPHARTWLERHGASGREPSRVLTARIAVRKRRTEREMLHLGLLCVALIAFVLVTEFASLSLVINGQDVLNVVVMGAFYLLMAALTWWGSRSQRSAERRIAASLPQRAAHGTGTGAVRVLGVPFVVASAATYVGGVAIGAVLAFGADTVTDRLIAAVFAAGTAVFAVITAVVAAEEVRRGALAEDEESLAADDLLRVEDAHRVPPFPAVLAAIYAVNVTDTATIATFGGFAVVTILLWAAVYVQDTRRKLVTPNGAVTA